ncbi:unnamed protein product [Blepharisma stoltei]|uniref:Uncharacterized protein n=1 Tax=Blepharisma stoltei TaxID=1481888 RepID=A0AAU9IEK9_9CILI|nr:unnamed protein product [Blepharisma stoltei]
MFWAGIILMNYLTYKENKKFADIADSELLLCLKHREEIEKYEFDSYYNELQIKDLIKQYQDTIDAMKKRGKLYLPIIIWKVLLIKKYILMFFKWK